MVVEIFYVNSQFSGKYNKVKRASSLIEWKAKEIKKKDGLHDLYIVFQRKLSVKLAGYDPSQNIGDTLAEIKKVVMGDHCLPKFSLALKDVKERMKYKCYEEGEKIGRNCK